MCEELAEHAYLKDEEENNECQCTKSRALLYGGENYVGHGNERDKPLARPNFKRSAEMPDELDQYTVH